MTSNIWTTVKIGNLGRVVTGKTPPTKRMELFGDIYPFITPTDIDAKSHVVKTARFLSEEGRNFQNNLLLPPKTICYTCIASIGKVCITDAASFTNQQINSIIVNEKQYDFKFIYYSLKYETPKIIKFASGAATPIISKSTFSQIELSIPPLPAQRKIAAILSAYDDLIENNTRRIHILEEMAQAIYREWFVNFRYPGHEGVPLVNSPLGKIPQGWEVCKLGDVAEDVRRSISPEQVPPDFPYFGLEHLPCKSIALSEWGSAQEVQSTKFKFFKGEILFGKIRPYFHKVGIAPVDGICSSDAIVIRSKMPQHFAVVLSVVSSDDFVAHATQTSQGTKMPRANWEILVKHPVVIPSEKILTSFNETIENVISLIENLIFKNRNLHTQRDLLLPRLVSGELDVEELKIEGLI